MVAFTAITAILATGAIATNVAAALTGKVGDGKIFISAIEDTVRIRTGEHGNVAV